LNVHVSPAGFPALVLNADFRPLSYYPLSLWSWQDAIKAVFLERVNIVANYDRAVRSPSFEMKIPSVVSLKTFVKPSTHPAFTRFNVFLRDRFACQYCGAADDLTFDHLIPRSRGGLTTWDNVVAACSPCNLRKGSKTMAEASMHPAQLPFQADGAASASQRTAVSAELPARKLDGLSLLGHRTGAVTRLFNCVRFLVRV
jgi:5-methylcytosine-specific restriction endonuclease McrA